MSLPGPAAQSPAQLRTQPSAQLPVIVLVATGGTIASRIDPATGLAVPVSSGAELLAALPGIAGLAQIRVDEFGTIPSPHITPGQWVDLHDHVATALADDNVSGVVISHGTGTMEETAWFLDLTISSDKPVVLTGAQRNASEFDFDGTRNLLNAVRIAASPKARGLGVLLAMNQHINAAREVLKAHSFDVEAFNSGEWGYLGNVLGDEVIMHRAPLRRLHIPLVTQTMPDIEIVSMYPGATARLLYAAAETAPGVVIQAIGTGHVNPPMYEAIKVLLKRGTKIVSASRIMRGGTRTHYGMDGSSRRLRDEGVALASDLSVWKARVLLMLALQTPRSNAEIQDLFNA